METVKIVYLLDKYIDTISFEGEKIYISPSDINGTMIYVTVDGIMVCGISKDRVIRIDFGTKTIKKDETPTNI